MHRTPFLVPLIWFIVTGFWTVALILDFVYRTTPTFVVILHVVCVVTSFTAAMAKLSRYRKERSEDDYDGHR